MCQVAANCCTTLLSFELFEGLGELILEGNRTVTFLKQGIDLFEFEVV